MGSREGSTLRNFIVCTIKILTGKPTGKTPLGWPRHRWEDNIKMNLEEIGINAGNWVDSVQDSIVGEPL